MEIKKERKGEAWERKRDTGATLFYDCSIFICRSNDIYWEKTMQREDKRYTQNFKKLCQTKWFKCGCLNKQPNGIRLCDRNSNYSFLFQFNFIYWDFIVCIYGNEKIKLREGEWGRENDDDRQKVIGGVGNR